MRGDGRQHFGVVCHAQLVRNGDQEGIGGLHRYVRGQLPGDDIWLADITPAEPRQGPVKGSYLVPGFAQGAESEVLAVFVVG